MGIVDTSKLNNQEMLVLASILKISKEKVAVNKTISLTPAKAKKFNELQRKLKNGWPLAYATGARWFYNHEFIVTPDVLIPRPETEILLEEALQYAKDTKPDLICDIGTGSGAIIISLRAEMNKSKSQFTAVDISTKALHIAKKNTTRILKNNRSIKFIKGHLAQPLKLAIQSSQNVLICANLPYLSKAQLKEPSIKREPKLALDGGLTSTSKIERLLKQLSKSNLKQYCILLEIDPSQASKLSNISSDYFPTAKVQTLHDLSGLPRIIKLSD